VHIERLREPPADALHEIRTLLFLAFADRFSEDDWQHCLGGDHFIGTESDRVVTHAAVVTRRLFVGTRHLCQTGYVEGVATAPDRRGNGLGSALMQQVNEAIDDEWELGALSTSRQTFYERVGWQRWLGPTFVAEGNAQRRTADEDAGVFVRVPPGSDIDLSESLTCEARSGDDW
jgi:aminoglycoside 2'-N-acetyltransferase I